LTCDIAVVGAGPSGLIAAGRAAEVLASASGSDSSAASGGPATIAVFEGNAAPGRKLLITGGGRCNLTNLQDNPRELASRYGREGRALISPFTRFDPPRCVDFFASLGLKTKVEAENRVFPVDDSAAAVLDALLSYCDRRELSFRYSERIVSLERDGEGFILRSPRASCRAKAVILATGGFARPDTGSDGSGFALAAELGHEVRRPDAMLVPIAVREKGVASLMGVSLPDCGIRVLLADSGGTQTRVLERRRGKLLFTHFGLSGPAVLNLSGRIGELESSLAADISRGSRLVIEINPMPDMTEEDLDALILQRCGEHPKKLLRNALEDILPPRFSPLRDSEVAAVLDGKCAELSRAGRRMLVSAARGLRLTFAKRMRAEDAIVARGGIPVDEVDFRTMESKICPGLYITGDMLDINRPSGGYSLQLCWATGWVAGESAVQKLSR
jgi:predicted Rossmann fold flavoprotein